MIDPAPAKTTEGRNRTTKRQNRGGNAVVAQAFYEMQPSISENMDIEQDGVQDYMDMHRGDSIGLQDVDYQGERQKESLLITDSEMLDVGDHAGKGDICNKCHSSRYVPKDGPPMEETHTLWVECGKCEKWYHTPCVNLGDKDETQLEKIEFFCCNDE